MIITTNTTICIAEQQIRILELFREYWGIQQINEVITNSELCVNSKNHRCNISWTDNYININYQCNREMHPQERDKFLTAFSAALSQPVPDYYTDAYEKAIVFFCVKNIAVVMDVLVVLSILTRRNLTVDGITMLLVFLFMSAILKYYPRLLSHYTL